MNTVWNFVTRIGAGVGYLREQHQYHRRRQNNLRYEKLFLIK